MTLPSWGAGEPPPNPHHQQLARELLTTDQVMALPKPDPLIEGLLNRNSIATVFGRPGAGKSFLAIDIAMHVANGAWWQGRAVTGGPVLYVVAEGAYGIGARVAAWRRYNRLHSEVHAVEWLPRPVNLLSSEWVEALGLHIQFEPPALIVFDTLARNTVGADENSTKDMGTLIEHVDVLKAASGACVLLVHHSGKDATRGSRGSSAITGGVDTELELTADGPRLSLHTRKQKEMAEAPAVPLALVEVDGTDSCAIGIPQATRADDIPAGVAETLAALEAIDVPNGLSSSAWEKASEKAERTFYRHRSGLVEQGLVVNVGTDRAPRYRAASKVSP